MTCLLAVFAVAACTPRKAENIPLEEAMHRTPVHLSDVEVTVSEARAAEVSDPIEIGAQRWVPWSVEYTLPDALVRPVAPVGGTVFHSFAWDAGPFDRLLVEDRPGVWQEYVEVR